MGTIPLAFDLGPWAVALRGQQQIRENKAPDSKAWRCAISASAPKAAAPWGVIVCGQITLKTPLLGMETEPGGTFVFTDREVTCAILG